MSDILSILPSIQDFPEKTEKTLLVIVDEHLHSEHLQNEHLHNKNLHNEDLHNEDLHNEHLQTVHTKKSYTVVMTCTGRAEFSDNGTFILGRLSFYRHHD